MYLTHFGLSEKPFKTSPDPRFLWLGARHKEALNALVTGVLRGDGFQVVTGDAGTGKTTLANALLQELGDRVIVMVVPCPEYEGIDFFKLVARAYGIGKSTQGRDSFVARFSDFMRSSFSSGKSVVLIIDEAQRLTSSCLQELLELSGIEENGIRLLRIVFFGEDRFNDAASAESNRGLSKRITFRHTLDPLTRKETAQYILHRLNVAQCESELFTPASIDEIFHYSQGVPSLINKACDVALSRNFFLGETIVLPETIRNFLKLMPEEKTAVPGKGTDRSSGMGTTAQRGADQGTRDDLKAEMAGAKVQKPNWNRITYAALGCFLVISIGFTLYVMKNDEPTVPAKLESKKEAAPLQVPPAAAKPSVSEATGQGSDSSGSAETSSVSEEVKPSGGAGAQVVKAKKRQTVGAGTPAGQDRRATREAPPRQAAEEPDPDKVIDWLLKKRAAER
jgi:type II secretory pathway predicted ATPase ExeA